MYRMSLPIVAIVGRPNVGKSSLLNALVGRRISIVDPTPGVTRDRVSAPCPLSNAPDAKYIELVDTGGMGIDDAQGLRAHVEEQIAFAIAQAALVLFLVDAREGVTPLDKHVAGQLRRQNRPVILVANKYDVEDLPCEVHDFERLGFGPPIKVSAVHSVGRSDLFEAIAAKLGDAVGDQPPESAMKLAIVGKRNAGKSTFINSLAGQERVIVSEKPGTTRDSIDVVIQFEGKTFTVIDTAGVQKRKSLAGDIEFYSYHRAMRSVRRADVVALMIDATVPVSQVDKDLAGEVVHLYKPVVIVVNKWDKAVGAAAGDDYQEYFDKVLPELTFAPILLATATEGKNVRETIQVAEQLFAQANTRVPTAQLNEWIKEIMVQRGPSHKTGTKVPKLLYASQIATAPPTIVCFVNDVRSFDHQYERYLVNQMRLRLPFAEVPIRLIFRQRREQKDRQIPGRRDERTSSNQK